MLDFEFVPTLVTVKRHWVVCMLKMRSEFLHFITTTCSTNKALIKNTLSELAVPLLEESGNC